MTWTPRFQVNDKIKFEGYEYTITGILNERNNQSYEVDGGPFLFGEAVDYGKDYGKFGKVAPAVLISGSSKIGGKRKRSRGLTSRSKKSKRRVQKRKSFKKRY